MCQIIIKPKKVELTFQQTYSCQAHMAFMKQHNQTEDKDQNDDYGYI